MLPPQKEEEDEEAYIKRTQAINESSGNKAQPPPKMVKTLLIHRRHPVGVHDRRHLVGTAVTNCCGWNPRSEGASHCHSHEPFSDKKANVTGKEKTRKGTTAFAQRRL
jgi:hypothetical protein